MGCPEDMGAFMTRTAGTANKALEPIGNKRRCLWLSFSLGIEPIRIIDEGFHEAIAAESSEY